MIQKMCRSCGKTFQQFNKLQTKCGLCAFNLHAKPSKPMKRMGKVGKQWLDARAEWVKNNPPNHQGVWACALRISPNCLGVVDIDQLQVDHDISRSRDQSKRTDQSNLQASCGFCNSLKGSKSTGEIRL